jgi:hypothetical protein
MKSEFPNKVGGVGAFGGLMPASSAANYNFRQYPKRFFTWLTLAKPMVPQTGFEPVTPSLRMTCSTS